LVRVFDVDELVTECRGAIEEHTPVLAVREVLRRALEHRDEIEQALPATRAELTPLYLSDELTVLKLVWAPGMWLQPHDHRMWAAIAIYGGREDNTFYRREGGGAHVVATGGKELHAGDVALLGDDVVHSVMNPLGAFTGAIHVYGGNFFTRARSDWSMETLDLETDVVDRSRYFEEWNERLGL
jgi:predicted metal-dependent enzyme (double-stranded beta helix superfamily)